MPGSKGWIGDAPGWVNSATDCIAGKDPIRPKHSVTDTICVNRAKDKYMESKPLDVTNMEQLKNKVSDVKVHGDPGKWVCVGKASSEGQGWMKSTKVMQLGFEGGPPYGCLVQVSTQQRNPDGSYSLAEAVTYCPEVNLKMFETKGS